MKTWVKILIAIALILIVLGFVLYPSVKKDAGTENNSELPTKHICTETERLAEICTMEYAPVCGSDGQTYGNGCSACSLDVDYWIQGEC